MSKRWDAEEDAFLLTYHGAVGANFVANHDLGRPWGAGERRLKALTKSGARLAFVQMMIFQLDFERLAGRYSVHLDWALENWERELAELLSDKGVQHD